MTLNILFSYVQFSDPPILLFFNSSFLKLFYVIMILQIATPNKIIIFDFLALSGVGSRRGNLTAPHMAQLTQCANILLKNLFSANDIVKVGWSFSTSDLDMLRSAGGGETD